MASKSQSISRRGWLLGSLQASIAVTLAVVSYPVVRFLWPRVATSSGSPEVVAPMRVDQLRPDAEGNWPPPFDFGGQPCLVILTPDGEVKAFNAICTHVDCTVKFRSEEGDIFCNCHNGIYDVHGRAVSGPPPRPLEEYNVTLRGNEPGKEEIIVSRTA